MPSVIILNIHRSSLICPSSSSLSTLSAILIQGLVLLWKKCSSPLASKLGKMELQMSSLITLLTGLLKSALPRLSSYLLISHLDNKVFQVAAYWFDLGMPCWTKKIIIIINVDALMHFSLAFILIQRGEIIRNIHHIYKAFKQLVGNWILLCPSLCCAINSAL